MSLRGARVLVTGATGFTARYVIPLLEEAGAEVWRLARGAGTGSRDLVCDITDAGAVRDALTRAAPDVVVHLAGTSNLPDDRRQQLISVNVAGTENVLSACAALQRAPRKILVTSSAYVYGDTGAAPADESCAMQPSTEYGRSKLEMERVARSFQHLPVVIARPFNYTGVGHGEQFLVPKLVKAVLAGDRIFPYVQRAVERDFSDVRWIAEVYAHMLSHARPGAVYNVCSGQARPVVWILEELLRIVDPSRVVPFGQSPVAPTGHRLSGSIKRLRHDLPLPRPIPLEETLRWMVTDAHREAEARK